MRNANERFEHLIYDRETNKVYSVGDATREFNCPVSATLDMRTQEEKDADMVKRLKYQRQHSSTPGSDFTEFTIFILTGDADAPQGRILHNIDLKHVGRLAVLATYIKFNPREEKTLIYNEDRSAPMTRAQMQELLQLQKREFIAFLNDAKDARYLEEKDGVFYLCNVFHKGSLSRRKFQNINLLNVPRMRALYATALSSDQKFIHRSIGSIIALMPYIHKEYNVLCKNPKASSAEEIEPLTDADICRLLGYGIHNAQRTMESIMRDIHACPIKVDGRLQYFLARVEENGQVQYIVNPHFIYIGRHPSNVLKNGRFYISKKAKKVADSPKNQMLS